MVGLSVPLLTAQINFVQFLIFYKFFRQAALKAAATVPILNKEPMRQALQPRPNYPNVYDSQSHAKQASGENVVFFYHFSLVVNIYIDANNDAFCFKVLYLAQK